jgi:glycosyltransferase involved in cell wall biosynthesis
MSIIPIVSVIIPSYNYGFVIAETLASLQKQTLSAWEAIIVDDGSKDNTEAVVQDFVRDDSRIIYLKQANAGLPAARNTGMRAARGKYIQFLDADDLLGSQKLQLHISYLESNPQESIAFSDARYFIHDEPEKILYSIDGKQQEPLVYKTLTAEQAIKELFKYNIVVSNSPVFRKKLIDEVGLCDERMTSLEDWDYWFRMALCGHSFCYVSNDQAMALIRIHKASMSWNWNKMTLNRHVLQNNVDSYIKKFVHDPVKQQELLLINRNSSLHYLGSSVFMNIKFYNIWWGIKNAIRWSHEFKEYRYFLMGSAFSMKVRLRNALSPKKS